MILTTIKILIPSYLIVDLEVHAQENELRQHLCDDTDHYFKFDGPKLLQQLFIDDFSDAQTYEHDQNQVNADLNQHQAQQVAAFT